jgi:hypothetical protein
MTAAQKEALVAAIAELEAMPAETAVDIYKILKKVEALAKNGVKDMAKGYSRQRIIEQLNELVEILDARISMELIADGEWNPEEIRVRPIVTENGIIFPSDHTCESKCETCGKCKDKACTMDACTEKCMGHKTETPKDDENKEFDVKGAIIVGVIAGVVLIGTGVTLAVILTKKKAPAQEKEETKEETQK